MVVPANVVTGFVISVTDEEKSANVDFCHLTTFPVLPSNTRSAGVLPLQKVVWLEETVPPTDAGSSEIVTFVEREAAEVQPAVLVTIIE